METNRKLTVVRLLVLGVLVAGFHAKPASAQVFKGKFTLPFTARWNSATLPAGDYSFTLDKSSPDGMVMVFRGTRCMAIILTRAINDITSDRSELVLEDGAVRELRLADLGLALAYPAHNPRHQATSDDSQVAQNIPVSVAKAGR